MRLVQQRRRRPVKHACWSRRAASATAGNLSRLAVQHGTRPCPAESALAALRMPFPWRPSPFARSLVVRAAAGVRGDLLRPAAVGRSAGRRLVGRPGGS
eukprot:280829-Chlamydomonas_euryale.AAC.6